MFSDRPRTRPGPFFLVALMATIGALVAPLAVGSFYLLVLIYLPLLIAIVSVGLGLILTRLHDAEADRDDA